MGCCTIISLTTAHTSVSVDFLLENKSKHPLHFWQQDQKAGHLIGTELVHHVAPGKREGFSGQKTAGTATGIAGTVAWEIEGTNKMLVVMYSVPYSQDFHSNWLAVGIFHLEDTDG